VISSTQAMLPGFFYALDFASIYYRIETRRFYPMKRTISWSITLLISHMSYGQAAKIDSLTDQLSYYHGQRLKTEGPGKAFNQGLFDSTLAVLLAIDSFHLLPIEPKTYGLQPWSNESHQTGVSLSGVSHLTLSYEDSPDHKLRVYTWNRLADTCAHQYRNYVAYKSTDGSLTHHILPTNSGNTSDWQQFSYYRIINPKINGKQYYFFQGFNMNCEYTSHRQLRIFEITENTLIESSYLYPNGQPFEFKGNQIQSLYFRVQPNGTVFYNEPLTLDRMLTNRNSVFELVTYQLNDGVYTKQAQKKR